MSTRKISFVIFNLLREDDSIGVLTDILPEFPKARIQIMTVSSASSGPILIIEDDKKTASLVALYLEREGFQPRIAYDGQQGLEMARQYSPSLVILDLMLPVMDGWEVCRRLRKSSEVPIIMLTARDEEVDLVSGLTMGADDYVAKPFSPRELVARVKAVLRRGHLRSQKENMLLTYQGLVLDSDKHKVTLNGSQIFLTSHEYKLLQALMATPGKVFTRDELVAILYPREEAIVIDRVIDVHIGKLRQKIEKDSANPQYILTVRGVGYCFVEGMPNEQ
jgi:DNA-binding response OmpR family regulator